MKELSIYLRFVIITHPSVVMIKKSSSMLIIVLAETEKFATA